MRGWTLQELIAPERVEFFDQHYRRLGSLSDCVDTIAEITKIPGQVLRREASPSQLSIACRMSWASSRTTTRVEDEAYALFGLFAIHMPLLYGEGRHAFKRLQEEIIRVSTDQTIFAWYSSTLRDPPLFLATSAKDFEYSRNIIPRIFSQSSSSYEITNSGLEISLRCFQTRDGALLAVLDCVDMALPGRLLALTLRPPDGGHPAKAETFVLAHSCRSLSLRVDSLSKPRRLVLLRADERRTPDGGLFSMSLQFLVSPQILKRALSSSDKDQKNQPSWSLNVLDTFPRNAWDLKNADLPDASAFRIGEIGQVVLRSAVQTT